MINITMVGDRAVFAKFAQLGDALRVALNRRIWNLVLRLEARVKGKLSGQVLNVRTGALRRSIQSDVAGHGDVIVGRVFSSGDVKYARIHEFGGQTKAHIIEAKNGKALRFARAGLAGGGQGPDLIFAKRVHHPGSKMPERSFLRSSLSEMREEIIRSLEGAPAEAMGKS